MFHIKILFCLFLMTLTTASAQEVIRQTFRCVDDSTQKPLPDVDLEVKGERTRRISGKTDSLGVLTLELAPGFYNLKAKRNDYRKREQSFVTSNEVIVVYLNEEVHFVKGATIIDTVGRATLPKTSDAMDQITPLKARDAALMGGPVTGIEGMIMRMGAGTSSEFSSQYRVRGGNYDENLIYINNVEIYRPQIIRSGLQEGLGMTNASLAKDVTFSTGGFQARYGDKLSSVLNITYDTPNRYEGSAEIGLLTQNLHLQGSTKNKANPSAPGRFTFLVGARRFSTTYLLNTLDTKGDYRPTFWDIQSLLAFTPRIKGRTDVKIRERKNGQIDTIYRPKDPLTISLLTISTRSRFFFRPSNRETTFGTFNTAMRLFVAFDGMEETNYTTGQSALVVDYTPNFRFNIKHIVSGVLSEESEMSTVEGGYRLGDVKSDFGSDKFNEVVAVRGVGTDLRNARNYLSVRIFNFEQKGTWRLDKDYYKHSHETAKHTLLWGLRYQMEYMDDAYHEWTATDSSDYLKMTELIRANNIQKNNRFIGYTQYNWRTGRQTMLITGVRAQYASLNEQLFCSPRVQFVYDRSLHPIDSLKRQFQLRWAIGMYAQPPFFRELRDFQGVIHPEVRAQKSIHYIFGGDYVFKMWDRPFKLFAEVFYKQLFDLVPYEIENVRLRYYPDRKAQGYAYGFDARLNGQFISGVESWFSLSYLQTREDVAGDNKGYVRRPSDQRFIITFFFQDELPNTKSIKVHVNYVFNSGLPFGPPRNLENRTVFQSNSYHRVDIGISKLITLRERSESKRGFQLRSIWISLEVFNLLQRQNTISYTWVQDVYDTRYAVPNYLSARLFNARVLTRF